MYVASFHCSSRRAMAYFRVIKVFLCDSHCGACGRGRRHCTPAPHLCSVSRELWCWSHNCCSSCPRAWCLTEIGSVLFSLQGIDNVTEQGDYSHSRHSPAFAWVSRAGDWFRSFYNRDHRHCRDSDHCRPAATEVSRSPRSSHILVPLKRKNLYLILWSWD